MENRKTGRLKFWLLPLLLLVPVIAAGAAAWMKYGKEVLEMIQMALKAGLIP